MHLCSKCSLWTSVSLSNGWQLFLCNRQSLDDPLLQHAMLLLSSVNPFVSYSAAGSFRGLTTYTVLSLHDFNGHVIRGEWSLQRYSSHESQGQSQIICLILQSAVSVNGNHVVACTQRKRK